MGGQVRALLRFLRAHPWWTGTAALAILVFGGWWAREEWAARRLQADIAEWRKSRPVLPAEEPVPMGENAVAGWVEAIRAMPAATQGGPGAESLQAGDLAALVKANEADLALPDA